MIIDTATDAKITASHQLNPALHNLPKLSKLVGITCNCFPLTGDTDFDYSLYLARVDRVLTTSASNLKFSSLNLTFFSFLVEQNALQLSFVFCLR